MRRANCLGWFNSKEDATKAIDINDGDIYENGWYDYVMMEEFPIGIFPNAKSEVWFYWSADKWECCDRPEKINSVNFGMG